MAPAAKKSPEELLAGLKAELEEALDAYRKIVSLRAKKIEQEREQVEVYLGVLEDKLEKIRLTKRNLRKIGKVLSPKPKPKGKRETYRRQQDKLEDRFLEIQKLLVNLISKGFKY